MKTFLAVLSIFFAMMLPLYADSSLAAPGLSPSVSYNFNAGTTQRFAAVTMGGMGYTNWNEYYSNTLDRLSGAYGATKVKTGLHQMPYYSSSNSGAGTYSTPALWVGATNDKGNVVAYSFDTYSGGFLGGVGHNMDPNFASSIPFACASIAAGNGGAPAFAGGSIACFQAAGHASQSGGSLGTIAANTTQSGNSMFNAAEVGCYNSIYGYSAGMANWDTRMVGVGPTPHFSGVSWFNTTFGNYASSITGTWSSVQNSWEGNITAAESMMLNMFRATTTNSGTVVIGDHAMGGVSRWSGLGSNILQATKTTNMMSFWFQSGVTFNTNLPVAGADITVNNPYAIQGQIGITVTQRFLDALSGVRTNIYVGGILVNGQSF